MQELNPTVTPKVSGKGRASESMALKGVLGMINTAEFSETEGDGPFRPPADPIPGTKSAPAPVRVNKPAPPTPKMPVPAPPAPRQSFALQERIYTTGRLMVGKDHVLKSLGYDIVGLADPLYKVQEYFFPGTNKADPGARKLLQIIGQWGRGQVDDQYPLTPDRAIFVMMLRHYGAQGQLDPSVDWKTYGLNPNIWLDALARRLEGRSGPLAVSNCRFDNEVDYFDKAGWTGYHVMCSPKTWRARLKAAGLENRDTDDFSEQLAISRDRFVHKTVTSTPRGPVLRVIWNDPHEPCPSARLIDFSRTDFTVPGTANQEA